MTKRAFALRSILTSGAVVLAAGLGTAGVAAAASNPTPPSLSIKLPGGATGHHGEGFGRPDGPHAPALTGATLTSATAAANTAVPGATVVRTMAGPNSTYVVVLKKTDGTFVTVIENSSFAVTSTLNGRGPRPGEGPHAPDAPALTGATLTSAVAAANTAVPGATVVRTMAGPNSTYVVVLKKTDGTFVTVIENSSFVVTSNTAGLPTPPAGAFGAGTPFEGPNPGDAPGSSNQ